MIIYVDGFNAIHTNKINGSKKELIEALIHLTSQTISSCDFAHIVLDGFPEVVCNPYPCIKLHFSGNASADDMLVRLIQKKKLKSTTQVVLITNDNELKSRVKQLGVNTQPVQVLKTNKISNKSNKKRELQKEIPFDSTLLDSLLAHRFNS